MVNLNDTVLLGKNNITANCLLKKYFLVSPASENVELAANESTCDNILNWSTVMITHLKLIRVIIKIMQKSLPH